MSKSIQAQIVTVQAAIAKLTEKLTALQEKAANFLDVRLVAPGAIVEFPFGRAEKRRTVSGEVRKVVEGVATIFVDNGEELFVTKLNADLITKVISSPVVLEDAAEEVDVLATAAE
jgi:hypothetical protein